MVIGIIYFNEGDTENAVMELQKTLEIDPQDVSAAEMLKMIKEL